MKLNVQSDVLVRGYRALLHAASRDETRAHLNSIWIRAINTMAAPYMFATNGHWLAAYRLDGATVDDVGEGLLGIGTYEVKRLTPTAPQKATPTAITVDGTGVTFDFGGFSRVTVRRVMATPPPVHTIVPNKLSTKKHARAALSIDVLEPALKAVREVMRGRKAVAGVKLYAMGPTNCDPQLLWSAQCPGFFAYLMPFRDGTKRDMKWWHDASDLITAAAARAAEAAKVTDAAAE